jgi:hypothetical protein
VVSGNRAVDGSGEVPMGVVERLLALLPASTLVRWRAVWR